MGTMMLVTLGVVEKVRDVTQLVEIVLNIGPGLITRTCVLREVRKHVGIDKVDLVQHFLAALIGSRLEAIGQIGDGHIDTQGP